MQVTLIEMTLKIKLMVFDVDGVLTDGKIYISESGEEIKSFNVLDGHGLRMLKQSGVELAIISARKSRAVEVRAHDLGIEHVYLGVESKIDAFQELLDKLGISGEQAGCMGDDLVDVPVMRRSGVTFTVPDATGIVRDAAHYVTKMRGGQGAVREVCEFIMQIQGTYDRQIARYIA